jgi:osmoprotectant transport system ATP-binding protein
LDGGIIAMIEFEQVEKRYGEDAIAVHPFDLTIEDNQFICVIGTSGIRRNV